MPQRLDPDEAARRDCSRRKICHPLQDAAGRADDRPRPSARRHRHREQISQRLCHC
ncbi:MAG: hypothetical protein MZV64_62365 [Ignavibacteriales bacterium]|nr:hypothetical protein [Ignavibacteriales bacterium]